MSLEPGAGEVRTSGGDGIQPLSFGEICTAFSDRIGTKVGCDIEEMKEFREPVARRFFCQREYEHIMGNAEADRAQIFYRYWVLKESFMKATRKGMALDLGAFEIGWDEAQGPVLVRKPEEYPEEYIYREYTAEGVNARIAVCTTDTEIDGELHVTQLQS